MALMSSEERLNKPVERYGKSIMTSNNTLDRPQVAQRTMRGSLDNDPGTQ